MKLKMTKLAAFILAASVFTTACVDRQPGKRAASTSIPEYVAPADGRGWPSEPLDQPRPWPSEWFTHYSGDDVLTRGACSWLPEDLLTELGWTGEEVRTLPPCVVPLPAGKVLQINALHPYQTLTDSNDDFAFLRPIEIAGLEAREFSPVEVEAEHPGTCIVSVNTRSITSLDVLVGTADWASEGTEAGPQCEKARTAAKRIVETFVPLAGGTPHPKAVQSPDVRYLRRHTACELFPSMSLFGASAAGDEQSLEDGAVCVRKAGKVQARAWVTTDQDAEHWHTQLPSIGEDDLTAEAPLGELPGRVQLGRARFECARSVFVGDKPGDEDGVVLGLSFTTSDLERTAAELCLIAQNELAVAVEQLMDR